jgi:hypothetical protein
MLVALLAVVCCGSSREKELLFQSTPYIHTQYIVVVGTPYGRYRRGYIITIDQCRWVVRVA